MFILYKVQTHFAQGSIICLEVAARLSCPRPIFTLVSGNVRLVPELGGVLNKLHSVLLTAKVCKTQIKTLCLGFRLAKA